MAIRKPPVTLFDIFNVFIMILVFVMMVYPFWYVICYSLSDPSQTGGGLILWPRGMNADAYVQCFRNQDILNGFVISIARTIIGPFAMLLVSSMLAYVLTKNDLLGIKKIRKFCLFSMYLSGGLLPTYMVINSLRLTNSFWVYIIPGMTNVFFILLIRAYIESIPAGLEESALLDGAGYFKIYLKIITPLCMPVLAAVLLYSAVGQWNAYVDTQLYNYRNPGLYPLQYILYNYMVSYTPTKQSLTTRNGRIVQPQTLKMAITVITSVPIVMLYPFLQKYFVSGLLVGAVKA
ncbi:MAG: carbohydrate ABC transporter permease [Clostridiaceae bacterium]|nr:carbohydrate ABC transporter permease [Clostridiaceae bacterium]